MNSQADDAGQSSPSDDPNDLSTKPKEKSALEIGPLEFQPAYVAGAETKSRPRLFAKPGHWMPTIQRMQFNSGDFVGAASTSLVDEQMQPVPLSNTQFTFDVARPVVLSKERAKLIESEVFVPEDDAVTHVRSRLVQDGSGAVVNLADLPLMRMPSYQYYVVVLAKEASRYSYLKVADSVRAEWEEQFQEPSLPQYRVVLADTKDGVRLPSSLLCWSSIAYVMWDEVDVSQISSAQQQALLDWLHWGGRLIISGPDSLDVLRGSFLDKYLPADSNGPRRIAAADLRDWSANWSARSDGKSLTPLAPDQPLSGLQLAPRADAREIAGDRGLFYEKNVGRGSIVVSAMQLNERELVNWPGFDGLLNAVLLRRPPRRFSEGPYGGLRVDWDEHRDHRRDSHLVTGLRFLAHDAGAAANVRSIAAQNAIQFGVGTPPVVTKIDRPGGVGAWNDAGPVSRAASDALVAAAGVEMPGAEFIIACLVAYLIVLVPLNWMVFHAVGRVEWAWFAAPLIAVAGTYGVVRLAQLDIGFVRAQTEIAVLELQGEYPRGLVSRYAAFYSSLSTAYDVHFDNPDAVALPFAPDEEASNPSDRIYPVTLETHADTVLRGLTVASNSTRMLHSEQLVFLPGPLRLGTSSRNQQQVENYSGLRLHDVAVVRRYFQPGDDEPQYEASWIGELRDGASVALGLKSIQMSADEIPFAAERESAARASSAARLDIDGLLKLAFHFPGDYDPRYARREELRLVGRIDEVLPGATVKPSASQVRGATVIVAHLRYGDLPPAMPDLNSRADLNLTNFEDFNAEPAADD